MNPVAEIVERAGEKYVDRIAIVDRAGDTRRTATHGEIRDTARRVGATLRKLGVRRADRVLLSAGNTLEFPAAWLGAIYAGATLVPTPILSSSRDFSYRLAHARCSTLIVDGARAPTARRAVAESGREVEVLLIEDLVAKDTQALEAPVPVGSEALGMVLYTSGTTGEPKGVAVSHETLVGHTSVLAEQSFHLGDNDVILGVLPLTHSYGCRAAMLTTFLCGGRCVLTGRFDAAHSLQVAIEEGVTWIPAVPTMFAHWGVLPGSERPTNLRLCLAAGAPLADEIVHRAERRLGAEIRQAYGMTEATLATINAPPDQRVLGSVGQCAPDSEVRIVDEHDNDRPLGQRGEIVVRGGGLMARYLDDPGATAQALRGGWMHSGDIGWLDSAGRLFVVDRIKDMIIRGGNNVYPAELEALLNEVPEVAAVAVVSKPHPTLGEEIVAVIEPVRAGNFSLSAIKEHADNVIARNKRPRHWAVVDEMPLGPSNKVLKRELRAWIASGRLSLED